MPIFEYQCRTCGTICERLEKRGASEYTNCTQSGCGHEAYRTISAFAIAHPVITARVDAAHRKESKRNTERERTIARVNELNDAAIAAYDAETYNTRGLSELQRADAQRKYNEMTIVPCFAPGEIDSLVKENGPSFDPVLRFIEDAGKIRKKAIGNLDMI